MTTIKSYTEELKEIEKKPKKCMYSKDDYTDEDRLVLCDGCDEIYELNLEKEIKNYFNNQPIITRSKGVDYKLIPSAEKIAKHFFELGIKVAQKGEEV